MNEVDDEYRKRMFQFELDCDDGKGNAYACHSVGEFVALIDRDYTKAGDVWRKNCDGKNKYPPSCFKLGMLLFKGQGVKEQSDVAAASKFEKACNNGHAQACYFLGSLLTDGSDGPNGVKRDLRRAESVYEKACAESEVESCFLLGRKFLGMGGGGGSSSARNPSRATGYLDTACGIGHAPSCRLLAVMFNKGDDGVPADLEKFQQYKERTEQLVRERAELTGVQVVR